MVNLYIIVCGLSLVAFKVLAKPTDLNIFNKFQQNDYKLKFERLELVSYNKDILSRVDIVTYKYNRTSAVANVTFALNVDDNNKIELVIQAFKFMSNEYRYFPVRFQVNACFAISRNLAGAKDFLKCGNFSGCPIPKNKTIRSCNWSPDGSQLPPLIPDGRYMLHFQMLYGSIEASVFRAYAEVFRPISY